MPQSVLPDQPSLGRLRRARALRRLYLAAVAALVVLSLAGLTGPRIATATATGGGYELSVEHMARSRAGMAGDMRIVVHHAGGFDGPVVVGVDSTYLQLFDEDSFVPQPSSSTADAEWVRLAFDPPPGDTLQVLYRARVDPDAHRGRDGAVAVLDGATAVVSTDVATAVMP